MVDCLGMVVIFEVYVHISSDSGRDKTCDVLICIDGFWHIGGVC